MQSAIKKAEGYRNLSRKSIYEEIKRNAKYHQDIYIYANMRSQSFKTTAFICGHPLRLHQKICNIMRKEYIN